MRKPFGESRGKNLLIGVGAGLYWGSSTLSSAAWLPALEGAPSLSFLDCLPIAVAFLVIAGLLGLSGRFAEPLWQKGLAAAGVVLYGAAVALSLAGMATMLPLLLALQGGQTACFILFWGLSFATLNKEEAEGTVALALLVTLTLYGVGTLVPRGSVGMVVSGALKVAGVLPFLLGSYKLTVTPRAPLPQQYSLLVPFILSRVFFGICMGAASCLTLAAGLFLPTVFEPVSVLLAIGSLAACLALRRRGGMVKPLLRIAPLVVVAGLVAPYFSSGDLSGVVATCAAAISFLSWIILSSVQLSDMKDRLGWDEARLSFFEKTVFSAGWLMSYLLVFALCAGGAATTSTGVAEGVLVVIAYAAVTTGSCLMASLIEQKRRRRMLDEALELSERQMDIIYDEIAREYSLTSREAEVMSLMARGYARPALCEKLVIAESTARSHCKHIYQKLDIHSREELYDLVEERKKAFGALKSGRSVA